MPQPIQPRATPIHQTGNAEWEPTAEDDNEAALNRDRPHGLRAIFFGEDGLRAGWSLLMYIGIVYLLLLAGMHVLRLLNLGQYAPKPNIPASPLTPFLWTHGLPFLWALTAAAFLARLESRPIARYGLDLLPKRGWQAWAGAGWGLAMHSLLIGILYTQHLLVFDRRILFGAAALQWGLIWACAFLAVGLSEEYISRGFVQFTLSRGLAGLLKLTGMRERSRRTTGFWLSALLFSCLFGLGHAGNAGESPIGLVSAGLIGLVFCYSLWRTGSLWWAVGYHAAWDWAESFLYGVGDSGTSILHPLVATHPQGTLLLSGGPTGPEGSVYVLPVVALTVLIIAVTLKPEPGAPADSHYGPNLPH